MRTIVLLILSCLVLSCGPDPCDQLDFKVKGLCVNVGEFSEINPSHISLVLSLIDSYTSKSLKYFWSDNHVGVKFVSPEHRRLAPDENSPRGYGGKVQKNQIWVKYDYNEPEFASYYVLGHEMLHVLSRYYLKVEDKDNHNHNVPRVFIIWALENNEPLNSTYEFHLYKTVQKEIMYKSGST